MEIVREYFPEASEDMCRDILKVAFDITFSYGRSDIEGVVVRIWAAVNQWKWEEKEKLTPVNGETTSVITMSGDVMPGSRFNLEDAGYPLSSREVPIDTLCGDSTHATIYTEIIVSEKNLDAYAQVSFHFNMGAGFFDLDLTPYDAKTLGMALVSAAEEAITQCHNLDYCDDHDAEPAPPRVTLDQLEQERWRKENGIT